MTPHDDNPLSERAMQAIRDGEAAWVRVSSGDWDVSAWWIMGTALTLIRAQVLHEMGINKARGGPYNDAFKARLARTKFATMESVTRSNLLYLMEPEIRVVLDRLLASWKPEIRARRTHPTTLAQYVRRELKPKPAPTAAKGKAAPLTDAARRGVEAELAKVRLENERLREQFKAAEARIRELAQGDHPRRIRELESLLEIERCRVAGIDPQLMRKLKAAAHPDNVQHPEAKAQMETFFKVINAAIEPKVKSARDRAKVDEEWKAKRAAARERRSRTAKAAHARRRAEAVL